MQLFLASLSDSWKESERQILSGALVLQATFRRHCLVETRAGKRDGQVGPRPEAWLEGTQRRAVPSSWEVRRPLQEGLDTARETPEG